MDAAATPVETDASPSDRPANKARRFTAFAILAALILALASLFAILVGITGEWAMSGKATLEKTAESPDQASPTIRQAPGQVITGTVTITAFRSDRTLLEENISAVIHRAGGYLIQERDGHRTYAAPGAMAEMIAERNEDELPKRPDHAAYGELLDRLKSAAGSADTSITVRVRSTIYENPIFLDTTIAGAFGVAASLLVLVISVTAISVIHTFNDKKEEREDEP